MGLRLTFGYASDTGQVRDNNEDSLISFYADVMNENDRPAFGVFVVADGMGGHQNGEKASAIATETIMDTVLRDVYLRLFATGADQSVQPPVLETLEEAITNANSQIVKQVPQAGTTVTAAVIMGNLAYFGHVGDSRAYLIRDGEIEQITEDHTFVNRLVAIGTMTREEAEQSGEGHRIYRALGLGEKMDVDTITRRFRTGTLLLCSDGLSGMVNDDAILEVVESTEDPQRACDMLVELANNNGGHDNVSVIVVKMVSD